MTLYYLDTSIWLDYYEERGLHGQYILQFLEKVIQNNDSILVSDIVLMELLRLGIKREIILSLFQIIKPNNYQHVQLTKSQRHLAHTLSRHYHIPWSDAAHAILAKEYHAILVSYDRDFAFLRSIVETKTPEELL